MRLVFIILLLPVLIFGQNGGSQNSFNGDCLVEDLTVTQIRALKIAGTLDPNCTYCFTRNWGSCLGEVTVCMQSENETQLSNEVSVKKGTETYWGRYDIDNNTTGWEELHDNRGNEVEGYAAILRFPWGDVDAINTKVSQNATWTCDCDIQYAHRDNIHDGDSNVDTRGLSSGYIYSTEFHNSVNVDFDNVGTLLCDDSYYGGIGTHDFSNHASVRQLRVISNNGYQYATGGTRFWIDRTHLESNGELRSSNGIFTMNYGKVSEDASVTQTNGTVTSNYSTYENRARINHNATGTHYDLDQTYNRATVTNTGTSNNYNYYGYAGNLSTETVANSFVYDYVCHYGEGTVINTTDVTRVNSYYDRFINDSQRLLTRMAGTSTTRDNFVSGSSILRATDKTAACLFYDLSIMSASEIRSNAGGANRLYRLFASSNSQQYYQSGTSYDNTTMSSGQINAGSGAFFARYCNIIGNYTRTLTASKNNQFQSALGSTAW